MVLETPEREEILDRLFRAVEPTISDDSVFRASNVTAKFSRTLADWAMEDRI